MLGKGPQVQMCLALTASAPAHLKWKNPLKVREPWRYEGSCRAESTSMDREAGPWRDIS